MDFIQFFIGQIRAIQIFTIAIRDFNSYFSDFFSGIAMDISRRPVFALFFQRSFTLNLENY